MNWTQIEGQWHQLLGEFKSQWGKLTDDDLATIAGKREQMVGKIQERYGIVKEDAEDQIDAWIAALTHEQKESPQHLGAGIGEMMHAKGSHSQSKRKEH
jgi:uncharacterized protein YjbJ (UPF0337 family)